MLKKSSRKKLVIGECGFGFGLNFMLTVGSFFQSDTSINVLHYLGSELHPVTREDLERFFRQLSASFAPDLEDFFSQYSEEGSGMQRLSLHQQNKRVVLDLYIGDATTMLEQLQAPEPSVDMWYLDGFAPRQNPAMWQQPLFNAIASHSKTGTTFSTYSASGEVRRGLEKSGFLVSKTPGFGKKRHMLTGTYKAGQTSIRYRKWYSPWQPDGKIPQRIAVLGAGLAGCMTASALAARGFEVSLVDKGSCEAQGASGNPRGVVHPKLYRHQSPAQQFHATAFTLASRLYESHPEREAFDWQSQGVMQLAISNDEQEKQTAIIDRGIYDNRVLQSSKPVDIDKESSIGGLQIPAAGSLNPALLCRTLITQPNIDQFFSHDVTGCHYNDNAWQLVFNVNETTKTASFDAVIFCTNFENESFEVLPHYPLVHNHGQVDTYAANKEFDIDSILCNRGYLIPWNDNGNAVITIGGSYGQGMDIPLENETLRNENLALLKEVSKTLFSQLSSQTPLSSRAGVRTTTRDFLPMIGPVENRESCQSYFSGLKRNARKKIEGQAPLLPNLYINTGHGSHGLTTTPLAAEILASSINRESLPVSAEVMSTIHPLRFLIRDLKKQVK